MIEHTSFDGTAIAVHELGAGRPVLLLHGLFSSADMNWIRFGHAARLAEAGFRCIMPDFRVHGQSAAPHDPAAYPEAVLVKDVEHLVSALQLAAFDLAGFSMGARTAAGLVARGMRPRRLLLCGMGWEGLTEWDRRRDFFLTAIDRRDVVKPGETHYFAAQFLKSQKIDAVAARLLLESLGPVDAEGLIAAKPDATVICGAEDDDNGSGRLLADKLGAPFVEVPGTHMSSVTKPELGRAIVTALTR